MSEITFTELSARSKPTIEKLVNNQIWLEKSSTLDELGIVAHTQIGDSARVQKTVKFGKVPGFRILSMITDPLNHGIGVGMGRNANKTNAKFKSFDNAKKHIIFFKLGCGSLKCTPNCDLEHSIKNRVVGKCGSTTVTLIPAELGAGIIAAPRIKAVLEQTGISDLRVKIRGSSNPMNCLKATYAAIQTYISYNE